MDKPQTIGDCIRNMTNEELAREMLFFRPTDAVFLGGPLEGRPCYMGLGGNYYETAEEAIQASIDWLRKPVVEGE